MAVLLQEVINAILVGIVLSGVLGKGKNEKTDTAAHFNNRFLYRCWNGSNRTREEM